jgi:hypothetical protein
VWEPNIVGAFGIVIALFGFIVRPATGSQPTPQNSSVFRKGESQLPFMKGAYNVELIILEYTSFVTAVGAVPPSPTGEGYNVELII